MAKAERFAIMVVDEDGDDSYLCEGFGNIPVAFPTRKSAEEYRSFMKIGMDGDVQSINVVPYPARRGGSQ